MLTCPALCAGFMCGGLHTLGGTSVYPGATYIPLAGIACFNTPHQRCIGPGAARWTSPLLRYNESFSVPTDPTSAGAARLIAAAGFGDSQCDITTTQRSIMSVLEDLDGIFHCGGLKYPISVLSRCSLLPSRYADVFANAILHRLSRW